MLDRVGVVSPCLEDGVLRASYGLLALTTAFYDAHRARSLDFFAYPQHFAFVGQCEHKVQTQQGLQSTERTGLWDAWGWLDVWPDSKWVTAPATASAMLRGVFDHQINRLFWPHDLKPDHNEDILPAYAFRMLQTDLKMVVYYGLPITNTVSENDMIGVQASSSVFDIVTESLMRLPLNPSNDTIQTRKAQLSQIEWYQPVKVDDFLTSMSQCFEEATGS